MARGDAGHVAEAAGREAQQRRVLLGAFARQTHQRRRREVRHVADDRHHLVVTVGRQRDHLGTQVVDDGSDRRERGVGRRRGGGEHPDRALEHRAVGAVEPVELAARHRMAADETRVVDRDGDRVLHAPDVGDDTVGLGERTLHLIGDGEHRGGDERDLRRGIEARSVDAPHRDRPLHAGRVEVVAGHVPAAFDEGETDRAPDQSEADDVGAALLGGGFVHGLRIYRRAPCASGLDQGLELLLIEFAPLPRLQRAVLQGADPHPHEPLARDARSPRTSAAPGGCDPRGW